MFIKIADIVFGASSDLPLDSLCIEDIYQDFLCKDTPDVTVHGHYSGLPDIPLRSKDMAFDSGIFWSFYKVDGLTVLEMRQRIADEPPCCIAVFKSNYLSGDVYYQSPEFREESNTPMLHPLSFPVFHLMMASFLSQGYGILMHACGIDDNGRGLLFPASSTHGKTTMALLWENEAVVLNDERIIVRQKGGRLWIYGTPWHGEYGKVSPKGVPLEKVFFLRHDNQNNVKRLNAVTSASELIKHTLQPLWDMEGMRFMLDFCAEVASKVACYDLGFAADKAVVDFIRQLTEKDSAAFIEAHAECSIK